MSTRGRKGTRWRFPVALAGASLVHGILLVAWHDVQKNANDASGSRNVLIELSLLEDIEVSGDIGSGAAADAHPVDPRRGEVDSAHARSLQRTPGAELPELIDAPEGAVPGASTSPPSPGPLDVESRTFSRETGRKQVRLFLGNEDLDDLVRNVDRSPRLPIESREDKLNRSLATPSSEVLSSPVSPAISAGYQAARFAPRHGSAVLEIRADEQGKVVAVRVVGAGQSQWSRVVEELRRRLQDRTLRMRSGSKGLVAKLRIDRGRFNKAPGELGQLERGSAMGDESAEHEWNEATQSLKERGGMPPVLDLTARWAAPLGTKISLLDLIFL